jgi:hypothetical protein
MRIVVDRGTPTTHSESLCDTCRHSQIVRGRRLDEELVFCDMPTRSAQITFKVTSCTHYDDQRHASYMQLVHQAWILRTSSRDRAVGFVPATELDDTELARSYGVRPRT